MTVSSGSRDVSCMRETIYRVCEKSRCIAS
jgi:hypothetical protein